MPVTSGSVGNWLWLMVAAGQIDCSSTLVAPSSRAEVGGCTVSSLVVHSDNQPSEPGSLDLFMSLSSALPGTSSWHAVGHTPEPSEAPIAASWAPCSGE